MLSKWCPNFHGYYFMLRLNFEMYEYFIIFFATNQTKDNLCYRIHCFM